MDRDEMKARVKAQREGFSFYHQWQVEQLRQQTFADRLESFSAISHLASQCGWLNQTVGYVSDNAREEAWSRIDV